MEKKNFKFEAYDSKYNEIELKCGDLSYYELTKEEAYGVQLGLLLGLKEKYKDPQVNFREI